MPQVIVSDSTEATRLRLGQPCPFRLGCRGVLVLDEDIEDRAWVRELVCSGCARREGQHRPPSAQERAEAEDWQARRREEIASRTKHTGAERSRGRRSAVHGRPEAGAA